jgi:hypothetical protein
LPFRARYFIAQLPQPRDKIYGINQSLAAFQPSVIHVRGQQVERGAGIACGNGVEHFDHLRGGHR